MEFHWTNPKEVVGAQYNLGIAYYEGAGVGQDKYEAIRLFRAAADQGHKFAIDNLQSLGLL